jgi:hypothetical protein
MDTISYRQLQLKMIEGRLEAYFGTILMPLIISFLLSSSLASLGLYLFFGAPGIHRGPMSLEILLALKKCEQLAYLLMVFLVPIISVLLSSFIKLKSRSPSTTNNHDLQSKSVSLSPLTKLGLYVLLPLALYFLVPQSSLKGPLDHVDEGLRLAAVSELHFGKTIYKDIFLNYGPLYEIIQTKIGFYFFGENVAALRKMDRLILPLGPLLIYFFLLIYLKNRWLLAPLILLASASPFFWIGPRFIFPVFSLFLLSLSWKVSFKRVQSALEIGSGFFISMSFLYSSEGGILLAASLFTFYLCLGIFAVIQKRTATECVKEVLPIVAGFMIGMIPFLIWITATGRLYYFLQNIHSVSSTAMMIGGKLTPPLFEPLMLFVKKPWTLLSHNGAILRLWMPVLLYMGILAKTLKDLSIKKDGLSQKLFLLMSLTGIFFFLIVLGRWDFDHWLKATPPFWILIFLWADSIWLKRSIVRIFLLLFLGVYSLLYSSPRHIPINFKSNLSLYKEICLKPLADDALLSNVEKEILAQILTYVPEGQSFFIFGNYAGFYFLTKRPNATPYSLECYILTPDIFRRTQESLDKNRPVLILADQKDTGIQFRPFQKPVIDFIERNYKVDKYFQGLVFLTPRN